MEVKIHCGGKLTKLTDLVPHPRNDNKHKEEHVKLLAKNFQRHGVRHPIIVSKRSGFIVAGHLRLMGAEYLEMQSYPVEIQDFESEAKEYEFLTSDNNIARYAEFDQEKMISNLEELNIDLGEFDFENIGLIDFKFESLLEESDLDESENGQDDENKKWIIQIQFPNEMEMRDIIDDLTPRGYIIREK